MTNRLSITYAVNLKKLAAAASTTAQSTIPSATNAEVPTASDHPVQTVANPAMRRRPQPNGQ
jgi:hypothetical protein